MKIKKLTQLLLLASCFSVTLPVYADNVKLPEIGTAAASTLSIGQEIEMGDYYTRMLRASAPIMNDPVLNQYINNLGRKLVAGADSVQTPFHFYIMRSSVMNAFAYFGGNVVIHSQLILDTDTESQLASVMSHEIGHVTQRHLARAMEDRNRSSPYVWGAALGSILLALASPQAGMAAMTTTMAGSAQSMISFTQSNEQEADRVGLKILAKSGFDPHASANFLQKLSDQSRFASKPPEILLTHPLPDSRLTDVRNRSNQYQAKTVNSSLDYYLAKVRLVIFGNNKNATQLLLESYKKNSNELNQLALSYGDALVNYKNKNYSIARTILQPLLDRNPNNVWFIDLMTDIDLDSSNSKTAVARLERAISQNDSSNALQLNLANAYIENGDYSKATNLLHRYTHSNEDDINGWDLLATAYNKQRLRAQELGALAEVLALQGEFQQAIRLLNNAKSAVKDNSQITLARFDARITQLQQLQERYKAYQR